MSRILERYIKNLKPIIKKEGINFYNITNDDLVFNLIIIADNKASIEDMDYCCSKYIDYIISNNNIVIIKECFEKAFLKTLKLKQEEIRVETIKDGICICPKDLYDKNRLIRLGILPSRRVRRQAISFAVQQKSISLGDFKKQLNKTKEISLNDKDVRELAKKPTGQIAISDLKDKEAIIQNFKFTVGKYYHVRQGSFDFVADTTDYGFERIGFNYGDISPRTLDGIDIDTFSCDGWLKVYSCFGSKSGRKFFNKDNVDIIFDNEKPFKASFSKGEEGKAGANKYCLDLDPKYEEELKKKLINREVRRLYDFFQRNFGKTVNMKCIFY